MIEKLLKIKEIVKKKKPDFKRRNAGKKKRLSFAWRKPKGWQNKQRLRKKGKPAVVEPGYGSPRLVRGFTRREGLKKVLIRNLKDVEKIDPKIEGAVLAASLGLRKKIQIYRACKERGIKIIEPKEEQLEALIKKKEKELELKRKLAAEKAKEKEKEKKKEQKEERKEKESKDKEEKKDKEKEDKQKKLEEEKKKILTKAR